MQPCGWRETARAVGFKFEFATAARFGMQQAVRVVLRMRPLLDTEVHEGTDTICQEHEDGCSITVHPPAESAAGTGVQHTPYRSRAATPKTPRTAPHATAKATETWVFTASTRWRARRREGITSVTCLLRREASALTPWRTPKASAAKSFTFDKVYGVNSTQEAVFDDVKPAVASVIDGFNCSILSYG